jgi:prepilin-type N-terminal cleavage/methylation domain-containing protein
MRLQNGFTLIEVLLTVTIFASFMMVIFRQHIFSVTRLTQSAQRLERLYELKKEAYTFWTFEAPSKLTPRTLSEPQPSMKVYFEEKEISSKSSLKAYRGELVWFTTRGVWQDEDLSEPSELELTTLMPKKEDAS